MYVATLFHSGKKEFYNNLFFQIMFDYGEIAGFTACAFAGVILVLSFVLTRLKKWRRPTLAIVLTFVVGAGLIVNTGFKKHWGRPRPREIVEFGGKHHYRPFWSPDLQSRHDPQKSFPSGHVAMGFFFISFYLAGKRLQSRLLTRTGLLLTLFLGCGLMVTRVVQGGHFVSDVLAAPIIMWYVAKAVDWVIWERKDRSLASTLRKPDLS
jgi:membrane-associated PAP2 superfamily phosphatase